MHHIKHTTVGMFAIVFLLTPFVTVYAASVTVQNLPSSTSVLAKTGITFNIVPSGFSYPTYHLADSFPNSTASNNNIEGGGKFFWVPIASDVGTHTFTFSISDNDGNTATVSQTITVLPAPSMKITSLSPGTTVMPGTALTFSAVATGFTNPTLTIGDVANNPSITNKNITATGNFSWTPTVSDNGDHAITVYAYDALGHSSSDTVTVRVGAGPSLSISTITPGGNVKPGDAVTFYVSALNYLPSGFSIKDIFAGQTSLSNSNINSSGQFYWIPLPADIGIHPITITGTVGAYGASTSTTLSLTVLGPNGLPPATPASATATSTANSGSTLSELQAQLAKLQSAMSGQSSSAGTPAPASSGYQFTLNLHSGSHSADVTELQKILVKKGFLTAKPNGYFGAGTLVALKKFQAAEGLEQLGVVGPATRAVLNALSGEGTAPSISPVTTTAPTNGYVFEHFMGVGDDDSDVLELQKRLIALGFLSGLQTGYYGSSTETAVKKFQKAHGITATGYVASDTRVALNH